MLAHLLPPKNGKWLMNSLASIFLIANLEDQIVNAITKINFIDQLLVFKIKSVFREKFRGLYQYLLLWDFTAPSSHTIKRNLRLMLFNSTTTEIFQIRNLRLFVYFRHFGFIRGCRCRLALSLHSQTEFIEKLQ